MQIIKIILLQLVSLCAGATVAVVVNTTIKVQQYKSCVAKSDKTDFEICDCAVSNNLPKYCNDILGN